MAYGKSKWSVENGCVLRRIKRYRQRTGPNVPHHGGYRCMRQISGNYRAHFNQSTWQAWNTRGHPRLLRIIVGRMIISQGSRGWKPIAPFSGERASDRSSNTAKSHICHPYPVFALYLLNFSVQLRVNLSRSPPFFHLSKYSRTRYLRIFPRFSTRAYQLDPIDSSEKKKKRIKIIGFTVIKQQSVEMAKSRGDECRMLERKEKGGNDGIRSRNGVGRVSQRFRNIATRARFIYSENFHQDTAAILLRNSNNCHRQSKWI